MYTCFTVYITLEGTVRYVGLFLAPEKGFALWERPLLAHPILERRSAVLLLLLLLLLLCHAQGTPPGF